MHDTATDGAPAPRFVEVVVPLPLEGRFHYRVPEGMTLEVGHRVLVPFGRRTLTGFVLAIAREAPSGVEVREVIERLDETPLVDAPLLELVGFAADYYQAPRGELLKIALPPGLTAASKRRWRLTAAGRGALARAAPGDASEPRVEALRAVAARKAAPPRWLERLRAEGLVEPVDAIDVRAPEERLTLYARTEVPVVLEALGRAKGIRAVLEALAGGPRTEAELRAAVGAATLRRVAPGLVADGWIRREPTTAAALAAARGEAVGIAPLPEDPRRPAALTDAQTAALQVLEGALDGDGKTFLLRGVTGSGKTEVYLRLIEAALARGRGAVVLVPEIALTTQLEARFVARFGARVAVLHSGLPDAERRRQWQRLRSGEAAIALGPRSAVWAPVARLGVVVVDEEHDPSFKQQNDVRYQGRDLALWRGRHARAVVVLGTATPSLETRWAVEQGRIEEVRLGERVAGRAMPTVELVDLSAKRERDRADGKSGELPVLSRPLADALREAVARHEQAILFLNRRGFNTIVLCDECKTLRACVRCDVGLTHHKAEGRLVCHRCGHAEPLERACIECGARAMRPFGAGTERVTAEVEREVPDARVLRLDRDVTQKVGALEDVLGKFARHEADVLVGTQMVTKGHDFPRVTVVGIVLADASLAFPDFRSSERTFQLLTQVAGRAGRDVLPGRVFVQGFDVGHFAITHAVHHDDEAFFRDEIAARRALDYPPIERLAALRVESKQLERAEQVVARLEREARRLLAERPELGLRLRGPSPAPIARVQDRHRFLALLLAPTPARLVAGVRALRASLGELPPGVEVLIDVDATDLL